MDFSTELQLGWQLAMSGLNLGLVVAGVVIGSLIGETPKLRAIHGVALFLPLTYTLTLPVESTLIFLLTLYVAVEFGHQRSAGQGAERPRGSWAENEQTLARLGSFLGGLFAMLGLILLVFLMEGMALHFGPAEYFVLVIFAFASLSIRAGQYPLRTLVSTLLGLMIATIGIDSTTGVLRFTLDEPQLYDGIEFTTVVIGLFVVSQLFVMLGAKEPPHETRPAGRSKRYVLRNLFRCKWTIVRSALSGFILGLLPGAGASIASSFSVQLEKRISPTGLRGQERLREIASAETANSAAVGGAMVPLLALGIPGSGTAAILLGALLLHNITPGPGLFTRHADLVWALAWSMCAANLLLLAAWPLIRLFRHIRQIPDWILAPALTVFAFVGVFSVNKSAFSLLIMLILGLLAYLLERWHYPLVPLLLGFVLGDLMENYLRRALAISGGDLQILYASNASKIWWGLSLLVVVLPLVLTRTQRAQTRAAYHRDGMK